MILALAISVVASAADPSPGFLLPGAAPVEPGWASVSVRGGGGYLYFYGGGPGAAGALTALGSPARGLVLGGSVVVNTIGGADDIDVIGGASLGARYLLVDREKASFGVAIGGVVWPPYGCCQGSWFAGLGLVAAGGGRVRWDLTLPLVSLGGPVDAPYVPINFATMLGIDLLMSEIGATFRVGERSQIRVGKYPGAIGLAWRIDLNPTWLEITAATSGILTYGAVEFGYEFGRPRHE